MKRYAIVLLLLAAPASAQDIPLSKILVEGEGWRPAGSEDPMTAALKKLTPAVVRTNNHWQYEIIDAKRLFMAVPTGKQMAGPREINIPGLNRPAGLALSPDKGTLFVGDAEGKHVWAFRVEADGGVSCGDRYCALRMKRGEKASGVTAVATDTVGCIYAATPLGVQIFDPTGRLCGVLTNPIPAPPTAMAFGGADGNMLYVAHADQVFVRKLQVKGAK